MNKLLVMAILQLALAFAGQLSAQPAHQHDHGPGGHQHADPGASGGLRGLQLFPLLLLGVGLVAAVAVIGTIALLMRRPRPAATADVLEPIDVTALAHAAPPASGPQLAVYNIPVRLVLLVLAPVGRGGKIPPNEFLPAIVSALAPNLMQVLSAHGTQFRRWPAQISSQGFAQVFFQNAAIPGGGKGTPWCSLAGRFDTNAGPFLAGLVGIAAAPNSLGQIAVSQPGQWLDILRVTTA
jgi:hypothetical protein